MPLTSLSIIDEIAQRMPAIRNANQQLVQGCVRLAKYLAQDPLRFQGLQRLENAMRQAIEARLGVPGWLGAPANLPAVQQHFLQRQRPRYAQPQGTPASQPMPAQYSHILSDVLSQQEQLVGLNLTAMPGRAFGQAQTFLAFIDPATFRAQVAAGRSWKDPTVPGNHGEFSHRIQWYLVTSEPGLQAPAGGWAAFYQWVGQMVNTQPVGGDQPAWANLGLWDVLLDRNMHNRPNVNGPYNTATVDDLRSPENLIAYMVQHGAAYNLLQAFLVGREAKRIWIRQNPQRIRDYIARKVYGVPYQNLAGVDQQTINNMLIGPQGVNAIATPGILLPPTPLTIQEQILQTIWGIFGY